MGYYGSPRRLGSGMYYDVLFILFQLYCHEANIILVNSCSHYAGRYYFRRRDACPAVAPRICACGRRVLMDRGLFFGCMVLWRRIHHTAEGQRTTAFRCAVCVLPLDRVFGGGFRPLGACWTRARMLGYVSFHWTCIALHSVLLFWQICLTLYSKRERERERERE